MIDNKRYVNRDVESIRREIYEYIREQTSAWNDFNEDTFESHIVDIVSGLSDMVSYYIDYSIGETKLMSAKQDKNIIGILESMNYQLDTVGTAKGKVVVSKFITQLQDYYDGKIDIPRWTSIQGDDGLINYLTVERCVFNPTDNVKEIPIIQGNRVIKEVLSSTLKKSYKYFLTEGDVPVEWVFIDDDSWEKVEDAFLEIKGGKKYSVHKDSRGRVYVMFTFDWKKYLPASGDEKVRIGYVKTLGTKGLVNPSYLSKFVGDVRAEDGELVNKYVSVYNPERTYGAFDGVDLNLHKANAKRNFRTMDRIILLDDFEAKVRKEPWVQDCTVYDWRRDITIVPEPHKMVAWVVTTDGVNTNQAILNELRNKLMDLTVEMTDLEIRCAEYVDVSLILNICVKGNNDYREMIRDKVEEAIREGFSVKNLSFGQIITPSDVEDIATRVSTSVRFPELVSFDEAISLGPTQFPNITFIDVRLVGDIYGQKTDN